MVETVTDIIIDAPAERVWQALADFPAYSEWNPLIRRVGGNLAPNARLSVTLAGSDGSERTAHPTVVHLRPGREIRWRDRPGVPWLMDTESSFKIEPLGAEQVRFVHWQATSGLLALFLGASSDGRLRERLEAMNEALKRQAERTPAHLTSQPSRPEHEPERSHASAADDRQAAGAASR
ncbi:MAG: SRPBCC domain-containing protein [Chloroflexota bacterium]